MDIIQALAKTPGQSKKFMSMIVTLAGSLVLAVFVCSILAFQVHRGQVPDWGAAGFFVALLLSSFSAIAGFSISTQGRQDREVLVEMVKARATPPASTP